MGTNDTESRSLYQCLVYLLIFYNLQEISFLCVHNTCTVMENDDIFTWKDAPQLKEAKEDMWLGFETTARNFQPKGAPGPWGRKQNPLYN